MRKKIVAGNWKMNLDYTQAGQLLDELINLQDNFNADSEVIICPSSPYLSSFCERLKGNEWIKLGSQNSYHQDEGAFTGEISPTQLSSVGIMYGIVGHSERRGEFNEDYEVLSKKVRSLLDVGITPIFCCGEQLQVRENNVYKEFIMKQIEDSLFKFSVEELAKIVIAYEPIWAIGTGKTASAQEAQEIHSLIRARITQRFGEKVGEEIALIYGGSCKPDNAKELFAQKDIDGGLIGGASLDAKGFCDISNSF
ncbi:triose-phosphate isomerase [Crocinitomix catalasitica]|nr:triose-phosphate isomerase [Crocinitomix catalasitica]